MRYFELFEGREAPLYHGTTITKACSILDENAIRAKTFHDGAKLVLPNMGNFIGGVSLSRSRAIAKQFGPIVFVLDQPKLVARHRIIPIDYFAKNPMLKRSAVGDGVAEAEEFVIGPIENLDRYLISISITKKWFENNLATDEMMKTMGYLHGIHLLVDNPKTRVE